jgi:dihydropteroate synthase
LTDPSHPGRWSVRGSFIALQRPLLAAVLNLTPDSFSDGGRFTTVDAAVRAAEQMLEEGADLLDVGGESTRPGATRITPAVEHERVVPVIGHLARRFPGAIISVDTTRAGVARAALDAGAHVVNDVSGLRLEPGLAAVVASAGAGLILMHSRGGVEEMASYALASYGEDVVADVMHEIEESIAQAREGGVADASIVVDPGIGFAKRPDQSIAVLRGIGRIAGLGFPVMVGASRKRVIGEITGVSDPGQRGDGTLGAHVAALALGARLFRVHDVRAHRHALDTAWRMLA